MHDAPQPSRRDSAAPKTPNTPAPNTSLVGAPNAPAADAPLSAADLTTLLALHERASAHGIAAKNRDAAIDALATLQSCADHLGVTLTRTIARVEAARRSQTGRTTSAVISGLRRIPTKHADSVVKTAIRHATYPDVLAARATGRISAPNATTVIRTLDNVAPFFTDDQRAEALTTLLDDAATSMPDAFRARCRSYLDEVDRQGSRTRAEQDALTKKLSHNKRFLSFRGNKVDGFTIRGHLPGTFADEVRSWIARESTRLARAARAKGAPVPGEATRDLDALVSLARKATGATNPPGPGPSSPQPRPSQQERPNPQQRPSATPEQQPTPEDPRARHIDPELRAHLAGRDGGCVAPDCTAPPERCDGHHIIKYSEGGPTTADNVCLVCARHHPQFENPPGSKDGWTFRLISGLPHAIPPTSVDPDQRPLLHDRLRPKIPLPKNFRPPSQPPDAKAS